MPFVLAAESWKGGVGLEFVAMRFAAGVWKNVEADRF
jgi:hypothetical protein